VRPLSAVFISRFFSPSQPSPRAEFSPKNFSPSLLISVRDGERVPSSVFIWRGSGIKQKPDPIPCLCPRPSPFKSWEEGWMGERVHRILLTVLVVKRGTANNISRERILARLEEVGLLFFFGEMTSPWKKAGVPKSKKHSYKVRRIFSPIEDTADVKALAANTDV